MKRFNPYIMRIKNTLALHQFPEPETEYRFHPVRKWRFDFAYPNRKIAIEFEGGTWNGGGHVRGSGHQRDCEKYNEATIMGWKVIRYSGNTLPMLPDDLKRLFALWPPE